MCSIKSALMSTMRFYSYVLLNAFKLVPPMLGDEMGVEVAEER